MVRGRLLIVGLLALAACGQEGSGELETPIAFVTEALPAGEVGQPYEADVEVSAPAGAELEWTLLSGALPAGLELIAEGRQARLRGVPSEAGQADVRLLVVDAEGGGFAEQTYALVIERGVRLAIRPGALPPATEDAPYEAFVEAQGGLGAGYVWAVIDGALPAGLSLSEAGDPAARLFGTPTETGRFEIRIGVADPTGAQASRDFVLEVVPSGTPLELQANLREGGVLGEPFVYEVVAVGGEGAVTWTSTGSLPGTRLATAGRTARLEGSPTQVGVFSGQISAEDAAGARATVEWRQRIVPPLAVLTSSIAGAEIDEPYSPQIFASPGAGGHRWQVAAGALPPGLSLDPRGAALGFAGQPSQLGAFDFTVEVADAAAQTATGAFTIEVVEPLEVVTTTLAAGVLGQPYASPIVARGGRPPFDWLIIRGAPPGIEIVDQPTRTTELRGIAGRAGAYAVIVQVRDADGRFAGKNLRLDVAGSSTPLSLDPIPPIVTRPCEGFEIELRARGGANFGYRWQLSGAPPGVELPPTGTPTVTLAGVVEGGQHSFDVTVSDSSARTITLTVFLDAGPPVAAPRYALVDAATATGRTLAIVDTCRRTPDVDSTFPLRGGEPLSGVWAPDPERRALLLAGPLTSTAAAPFVYDVAAFPFAQPLATGERVTGAPPRVALGQPASPTAPTRLFYETTRTVPVSPSGVQDVPVVRTALRTTSGAVSAPVDATTPAAGVPAHLRAVRGDGEVLVYGQDGVFLGVSVPGASAPLDTGVTLGGTAPTFVGFEDGDRLFFLDGGALRLADLGGPGLPVVQDVLPAGVQGAFLGPLGRRLLIERQGRYELVDLTVPGGFGPQVSLTGSRDRCGRRDVDRVWSPDGRFFACLVRSNLGPGVTDQVLVWSADPPTSAPLAVPRVVRAGATLEGARLSPDGRYLVVTTEDAQGSLRRAFVIDTVSALVRSLFSTASQTPIEVRFAPARGRVALASDAGLWIFELAPSSASLVFSQPNLRLPDLEQPWRADGTGLFVRAPALAWLDLLPVSAPQVRALPLTSSPLTRVVAYER